MLQSYVEHILQLPSDLDLHWTSRRTRGVPGRSDTQRRGEFRSDAAASQKQQCWHIFYVTQHHYCAEITRLSSLAQVVSCKSVSQKYINLAEQTICKQQQERNKKICNINGWQSMWPDLQFQQYVQYIGPTGMLDNAELDVLSWLLNNIFQYQKSDYLHLHQSRDRPKFVFIVGVENDCFWWLWPFSFSAKSVICHFHFSCFWPKKH